MNWKAAKAINKPTNVESELTGNSANIDIPTSLDTE
jgi:hypothetical protein